MKRLLALTLVLSMILSLVPAALAAQTQTEAEAAVASLNAGSDFYYELVEKYADSDIENRTEVRWWMAEGGHTDETLLEEVQAIYDAGFRGIELCQLNVSGMDETVWAYGSEQWNHDFHLVVNKCLDLGMTVGITSGTHWSTTNIPGLDPNSQSAMQAAYETNEQVNAGATRTGPIPLSKTSSGGCGGSSTTHVGENAQFLGAYAYKVIRSNNLDATILDLTDQIVVEEDGTRTLTWTAPEDGTYKIFYYWLQATKQESKPAISPSYCVNYFDIRGFEAWKEYFAANVLNDPALNEKIKAGDVQLFMDSLEFSTGDGFTCFSEGFAEEFIARKGYDIRPYLLLAEGLGTMWYWQENFTNTGTYTIGDKDTTERIINDLLDVQTQLYMDNYMIPMKEWLNEQGIDLRAQISYGSYLEISEPILSVDYPEAENRNQRNQLDMYRLWSGGSKLEGKVLSSETGAVDKMSYGYDLQRHMQEAYALYAAGFSRIIWHVWSSSWAPESVNQTWPGFEADDMKSLGLHALGTRNPDSADYAEMNQHMGRIQALLREGNSRTDVGMIYEKYGQPTNNLCSGNDDMWMQRHDWMFFPSMELQENGYTYDYFSPEFLNSDKVYYDAENGRLEQAGYKAIVLWQNWLDLNGAENLLKLAKEGLKVVVVDGAATRTPHNDGAEAQAALDAIMAELKALENVTTAATADDVLEALQTLDVAPYAGFENQQIVTQVRGDEDGNLYLYAWNYCDGSIHEKNDVDHGLIANTEIAMDGTFVPYAIDAWSGEVTQLAEYRWENGKTIFPMELAYSDVALYAFEAVETEPEHLADAAGLESYVDGANMVLRATETGEYIATTQFGNEVRFNAAVPAPYAITDWDVTVESWTEGEKITRTDAFADANGVRGVEATYSTVKTPISFKLDEMTTWDNIPEVGKNISGQGFYAATFNWSGEADGAYLSLGELSSGMEITINGVKTTPVNMNDALLDVGPYLQEGENTIEIVYSSSMTNVKMFRGDITAAQTWKGEIYTRDYRSYGPAEAILIPYVEKIVPAAVANVTVTGSTDATVEDELVFSVNMGNVEALATATLAVEIAAEPEIELAEGWMAIASNYANGVLNLVLINNAGMTAEAPASIATLTLPATGEVSDVTVAVTEAVLSAYVGEGEAFLPVSLAEASMTVEVNYSIYDVNEDGTVNQLDITRAQRLYGQETTEKADVDKDGKVTIEDLILILNNYSK